MTAEPCPACARPEHMHDRTWRCKLCGNAGPLVKVTNQPMLVPADVAAAYRLAGMLGAAQCVGAHVEREHGCVLVAGSYKRVHSHLDSWWRSTAPVIAGLPARDTIDALQALNGEG